MSDLDSFHRKFKSGNSVPVPQAVIKRKEYEAIVAKVQELETMLKSVKDGDVDRLLAKIGAALNEIKADGIEEMLDGGTMYCGVNDSYYEDDIREYADKLRQSKDGSM